MPRLSQCANASPYDVLGVSPLDDFATIRAAWRRLVKTWHPDVWYGTAEESTRRMIAVNEAYDTIARLHKRVQETLATEKREARQRRAATRRAPQGKQAKPAAKPQPARVVPQTERDVIRAGRPNPAEARFGAARAAFSAEPEVKVQAFA